MRPHFAFGTVEVRMCDVQVTAEESDALAALVVGCVEQAVREVDEGVPYEHPAPRLVEENLWRAIRFGMEGRFIDFAREEEVPTREVLERTLEWCGADAAFPRATAPSASATRSPRARRCATPTLCRCRRRTRAMDEQHQPPVDPEQLSEEQLRAAYEEQLRQIKVEDVIVQTVVSLLNLGGRRSGLAPGTEDEKDLEQVRQAVEAVRALLPLVEPALGPDAKQLRDVLAQLQMAYAREATGAPGAPKDAAPEGEGAGPAQSSGRLWVPGQ